MISPEEPFQIVVLCMGNICRSPMAEGLLRQQLVER
ncbi:MAG: low molecular weight phosphotyrosine protein phosphatase, partial [Acidimicrobiales bacterium]